MKMWVIPLSSRNVAQLHYTSIRIYSRTISYFGMCKYGRTTADVASGILHVKRTNHDGVGFVWGVVGVARVKAACEMPRPCVRNVEQAQGKPRDSKSSLTCAYRL